jgi:hypothetical protein
MPETKKEKGHNQTLNRGKSRMFKQLAGMDMDLNEVSRKPNEQVDPIGPIAFLDKVIHSALSI